jgi:zinc D-Ala-D-Ala dipeptidase
MSRNRMLVDHQVPILAPQMFASRYDDIPVDANDPRAREPLIRLDSVGVAFESYYARTDGGNPPFGGRVAGSRQDVWLRKSVAEKLAAINERLRPFDAELFVLDGYRPIACQRGLWNFFYGKARQQDASASEQECRAYALQFIVDPVGFDEADSRTWPAHTTGAAIDLTLRDAISGQLLDMGANFEEDSDAKFADFFERQLADGRIDESDTRLQNRRLLNWAMTREGLLNETSNVFWHYDWGNQIYVRASRAFLPDPPQVAWYGYISPPM